MLQFILDVLTSQTLPADNRVLGNAAASFGQTLTIAIVNC